MYSFNCYYNESLFNILTKDLPWFSGTKYANLYSLCSCIMKLQKIYLAFGYCLPTSLLISHVKTFNHWSGDSLLAEVSHDETNWNERREASAGFRRVVWWSRQPNFWSKLNGFQNRFRLMCNARALLVCTLTITEPTVDYGFHKICEFRNFSVIKSPVSTLGDKRIKK